MDTITPNPSSQLYVGQLELLLDEQCDLIANLQETLDHARQVSYKAIEARLTQEEIDADKIAALKRRCERLLTLNRLMMAMVGPPHKAVPWVWRLPRALTMLLSGR